MQNFVYLDYNATTPLHPDLQSPTAQLLHNWGNPSSVHQRGQKARHLLNRARTQIADLIGADSPARIYFTSSGTEANNQVLQSIMLKQSSCPPSGGAGGDGDVRTGGDGARPLDRRTLIVSALEHPSVLNTARFLEQQHGVHVVRVPVNQAGELDIEFYEHALHAHNVALVSIMSANNETGVLWPTAKLVKKAHAAGALFHCDAVQSLGKQRLCVEQWNVDFATFAGHKFYSLKGCGVLYVQSACQLGPLLHGGGQEKALRSGTENTLAIAAMGLAAQTLGPHIAKKSAAVKVLREYMEHRILNSIEGAHIVGHSLKRLPNTTQLMLQGVSSASLLMSLDMAGFQLSAGSACSSGTTRTNSVLMAMGYPSQQVSTAVRISLGWMTSKLEVDRFVDTLIEKVQHLREGPHAHPSRDAQIGGA